MDQILDSLRHLINPNWILANGGIWLVLLIIFAETGLFLGCFLPGDSLLFIVGMSFASNENIPLFSSIHINIFTSILFIITSGILGNIVGYWFGKKSGVLLYNKKNTFFFKQQYLTQTKEFYEKHGALTIVIARFLPIIRTFAPIIAGIVQMNNKKFYLFNIIGCVAWVFSMVLAGYFLGRMFPILKEKIDIIVLLIVVVTTAPVFYKIICYRIRNKKN